MPEPQLSVRGADVRDLAHRLSEEEGRSIRAVVTEALRDYEAKKRRESEAKADAFWAEFDEIAARIRATADPELLANESRDDLYDEDGLPA